jgi:hypothetical protein
MPGALSTPAGWAGIVSIALISAERTRLSPTGAISGRCSGALIESGDSQAVKDFSIDENGFIVRIKEIEGGTLGGQISAKLF